MMDEAQEFYKVWDSLNSGRQKALLPHLKNEPRRWLDARNNDEYRYYLERMEVYRPYDEPMYLAAFERAAHALEVASKELETANYEDAGAMRRVLRLEGELAI